MTRRERLLIKRALLLFVLIGVPLTIAWLNPRALPKPVKESAFVKIVHDGREIAAWDGPWSCVLDRRTGLVWEVKSYIEDMHDHQCSFSWFDGKTGVADGGSCFTASGRSNTLNLINYSNRKKHCGADNWRLPTQQELSSLLIEKPLPGDALIARDYFPYAKRGPYWTSGAEVELSGPFKRFGKGAVSVSFLDGSSMALPYRNAAFTRLVAKRAE